MNRFSALDGNPDATLKKSNQAPSSKPSIQKPKAEEKKKKPRRKKKPTELKAPPLPSVQASSSSSSSSKSEDIWLADKLDKKAIESLNLVDVKPKKSPQTITLQPIQPKKEDTWHEVKNPKKPKENKGTEHHHTNISVPKPVPKKPVTKTVSSTEVKTAITKYLSNPKPDLKPGITARKRDQLAFTHGEALHEGIKTGNVIMVIEALKAGADPNRSDPKHDWNKEIPLGLAARLGHYNIIRCLLNTPGIKVNVSYVLDSMTEESPVTPTYIALVTWKRDLQKRDMTKATTQEKIVRILIAKNCTYINSKK